MFSDVLFSWRYFINAASATLMEVVYESYVEIMEQLFLNDLYQHLVTEQTMENWNQVWANWTVSETIKCQE